MRTEQKMESHFFLHFCISFCCLIHAKVSSAFFNFVGILSRWLNVAEVLVRGGILSFVLNDGIETRRPE